MRMIEDATLYQIGVATRNLAAGMRHYERLFGITDWRTMETDYQARWRGQEGRVANHNAFARWGDLYLEMVEPRIGNSSAREWLDARGEGIFHLGYIVDGLPVAPPDVQVSFAVLGATPPKIIHLDTVAQLGYFVELAERTTCEALMAWIDQAKD
jgi:methylmalonyl-CoA/ethylmalonyl-CoA epimerase